MMLATTFLMILGGYLVIGAIVAIFFLVFAVSRVDAAAKGASPFFRPMIFLGCVALWPVVILRMLTFRQINKPVEDSE